MSRISTITKAVKNHDSDLFASLKEVRKKTNLGEIITEHQVHVLRRTYTYQFFEYCGSRFFYSVPSEDFVFALTDNWTVSGSPVDWGLEPICLRLRMIDLWGREQELFRELERNHEKVDESKARDRMNRHESFFSEFRKQFARTFDGVNTSLMSDKYRRL